MATRNLNCPICGGKTTVVDCRDSASNNKAIRRRRLCPTCDYRFTTIEIKTEEFVKMDIQRRSIKRAFDTIKVLFKLAENDKQLKGVLNDEEVIQEDCEEET